jgi:uridine phosphorylase
MNGLSMDSFYQEREPDRTEEALQSWQSLASLNSDMTTGDLSANLIRFEEQIVRAEECYDELYSHGFSERLEANKEYLRALKNSIRVFRELAEI